MGATANALNVPSYGLICTYIPVFCPKHAYFPDGALKIPDLQMVI